MHHKFHKINPNHGGSYIYSPDWIKKATINPINKKDEKYFQYTVTVTLNYEEIGKNPKRITKIKPFLNKYNLEKINFPSEKDDWKIFEKNNVTIALNVLYAKNKKDIYLTYVSKHNSNRESNWLYVLTMSFTRFRVNSHSIVVWMSRNSLLERGAISEF